VLVAEVISDRTVEVSRQARQLSNPFGISGHDACVSEADFAGEKRIGQCYNEIECLASGGQISGYCSYSFGSNILERGVCCVHILQSGSSSSNKYASFYNQQWPATGNGSAIKEYDITWKDDTCFLRLDFLTMELSEKDGNCVHDRFTVIGGKEKSGNLCGDRSGETTMIEPNDNRDPVKIIILTQSDEWRYNIGVSQISCEETMKAKQKYLQDYSDCGKKNPSTKNLIGSRKKGKKKNRPDFEKILEKKSAKKVFKKLNLLPELPEFDKPTVYRPSFTKQTLDYRKTDIPNLGRSNLLKARILYGNETDVNEYPWQISMWIDKSHFCGGTLVTDQWIVTAAHCVDLQYKNHFRRTTVSLGDHNVKVFNDAHSVFRKISRIVRFPSYDQNLIDGDIALLHLSAPVPLSKTINTACLPADAEEKFGFSAAVISGWGYTEKTKVMKPRPMTSDVLREADVFILPQDLCIKYSPFPITDKMICTFKGPLGVETTCQGDSGGPLVVNSGDNKWTVVGATSFGVSTCEGPYPSMFARVSVFLDFIHAAFVSSPFETLLSYKTPSKIIYPQ